MKWYFFNQVLAVNHTIFVVILTIEVWKIDDLKFQMMRIFVKSLNGIQYMVVWHYIPDLK